MANFLNAETCYRFISVRRCTPGALLWHAIGCERASRMPGIFGNVFLTAGQVADALKQAEAALAGLVLEDALARGCALAGHSNDRPLGREVIGHLPDGLRRALELRKGFMAIGLAQL